MEKASISAKNVFYTAIALAVFIGVVVIATEEPPKYTFELADALRPGDDTDGVTAYAFYLIKSAESINRQSISKELENEIRLHSISRLTSSKKFGADFYYLNRSSIPTFTGDVFEDLNAAYDSKPVAVVWFKPNDQVEITINPDI